MIWSSDQCYPSCNGSSLFWGSWYPSQKISGMNNSNFSRWSMSPSYVFSLSSRPVVAMPLIQKEGIMLGTNSISSPWEKYWLFGKGNPCIWLLIIFSMLDMLSTDRLLGLTSPERMLVFCFLVSYFEEFIPKYAQTSLERLIPVTPGNHLHILGSRISFSKLLLHLHCPFRLSPQCLVFQ